MKLQEQKYQTKRVCKTCKHYSSEMNKWPCVDCDMRNPADRWEPKDAPDANAGDMISRQAAIALADTLMKRYSSGNEQIAYTTIAHNEAIWEYQTALAQLSSTQSEYTCVGCKHHEKWENEIEYGYPSPCTRCKRRANDNYEQ